MGENIKILEEIKDMFIHLKNYGWINDIKKDIDTDKVIQSIENLINRNRELEEENEKLKREKVDNSKIILLAQSGMLDYQKGYEDGKARRMSAVQNIVENQQYYILKKQFEKYEKYIDKLKEENTELKNLANNTQWISPCYVAQNYIPKSKVKEKIEELHNKYIKILNDYGNTSTDIIINVVSKEARKDLDEIVNQIQILQELLERRK